ncbi:hypothetical protein ACFE04_007664 [Oxalis oulophora]
MMYGFGDDPNPLPKTVTLVEEIVAEYVTVLAFDHPVDYGAQSHTQRVSFSAYAMVGFVPRTHSVGESSGMGLVHTLTIGFISMETQLWWRTYIVPYRYGN